MVEAPKVITYPVWLGELEQNSLMREQPSDELVVEKPMLQLSPGVEAVEVTEENALSERTRPPPKIRSYEKVTEDMVENPNTFTTMTRFPFTSVSDSKVNERMGSL